MQCFSLPPQFVKGIHVVDCWGFLSQMKDGVITSYTVVTYLVREFKFVVFSEIGEWKAYTVPSSVYIDPSYMQLTSTDVDGIVHWINPLNVIIAYDPHRNPEALSIITFPTDQDDRMQGKGRIGMCGTHQGHLRYLESPDMSLSVWVLDDYGCGDN